MRILKCVSAAAFALATCPAGAQLQRGIKPEVGEEVTAPIGGEMLAEFRFKGVPGIVLDGDIHMGFVMNQAIDLTAGSGLAIIRDKKLKACQTHNQFGWYTCVLDMDGDGRIDKVALNDVSGARDVIPPVPYKRAAVRMDVEPGMGEGDDFKKVLIFTGVSGDTITVSYREFVNDLARPAFTENLFIPLGKAFPQSIAVKEHVFQIIGIDGMGLHYKLVK